MRLEAKMREGKKGHLSSTATPLWIQRSLSTRREQYGASNTIAKGDVWLSMSLKNHEHLSFTDKYVLATFNFLIISIFVKKIRFSLIEVDYN